MNRNMTGFACIARGAALSALLAIAPLAWGQNLGFVVVAEGLTAPLHFDEAGDGSARRFIAQQLTGRAQPYVNLIDNGTYLLDVSLNYVPLTQLGATHLHTPVFLSAGLNVISAANGSVSTDYYVRDGGSGSCTLP